MTAVSQLNAVLPTQRKVGSLPQLPAGKSPDAEEIDRYRETLKKGAEIMDWAKEHLRNDLYTMRDPTFIEMITLMRDWIAKVQLLQAQASNSLST